MMSDAMSKLCLFPQTAEIDDRGHLVIGGCDTVGLAAEFGTPLYLFDELSLRRKCAEYKTEFGQRHPETTVIYACKAFINKATALIFEEEGLGLDVVSEGELGIAKSVGFPMDDVYFHGNNKSAKEISLALEWGVGRIVVDNLHELKMLNKIAKQWDCKPDILLRLSPGVDPHTHQYITTGNIDSKFGFPLGSGEVAITTAMEMPNLEVIGLHFHLGSSIFEIEPYKQAIEYILNLAADMKGKHGFELKELDIGGGFAIQYTVDSPSPPISSYAEVITFHIISNCQRLGMALPRLVIEPGRSVVAQAGVALYRLGVVKDIPGVRCYVSVDGGMGDNIRPALYGARQEAVVANKMRDEEAGEVTIAGKFCESGDVLIRDIGVPRIFPGDILAVAGSGAYCVPMASNYNASFKPAIVLVKEGKARLIRRRETIDDLTRCDVF